MAREVCDEAFAPVPHFDKLHLLTISGVHRGVQRGLYDVRRDQEIPRRGINLVILKPSDSRGRLIRQRDADMSVIRGMLRAREPRDETADWLAPGFERGPGVVPTAAHVATTVSIGRWP